MSKEYVTIPIEPYSTPEMETRTRAVFDIVFTQPIDETCIKLMYDYTKNYIERTRAKPALMLNKYIDTIRRDNEILKAILKNPSGTFTIEELHSLGVSVCTIKTGLQRLWIEKVKERMGKLVKPRAGGDYQKFGFLPGQHVFYYGAFTGRVTRGYSPATHHFVYLCDGLIMEVGTALIDGCLDEHESSEKADVSGLSMIPQYLYKGKMSYFGFSTIYESSKWAASYGQTHFYLYDYHNDAAGNIIQNRLDRASELIGKWPYSLFTGSNNCENAANYIALGVSKSTQSQLYDAFSGLAIALAPPEIPDEVKDEQYRSTHEYDLRSRAEIPICSRENRGTYAERYITTDGHVCIGALSRGWGFGTPTCTIDKKYCAGCAETGKVTNSNPSHVCFVNQGRRKGVKILDKPK